MIKERARKNGHHPERNINMIRERVTAGMERAKKQGTKSGKAIGRPKVKVDVEKLSDAFRKCGSVRGAAREVGCTRGRVHAGYGA